MTASALTLTTSTPTRSCVSSLATPPSPIPAPFLPLWRLSTSRPRPAPASTTPSSSTDPAVIGVSTTLSLLMLLTAFSPMSPAVLLSSGSWRTVVVVGVSSFLQSSVGVIYAPERDILTLFTGHPIHIHLVDFKVLSRSNDAGRTVLPYESAGLKDVVWLAPNEIVTVEAHYAPWDGLGP